MTNRWDKALGDLIEAGLNEAAKHSKQNNNCYPNDTPTKKEAEKNIRLPIDTDLLEKALDFAIRSHGQATVQTIISTARRYYDFLKGQE